MDSRRRGGADVCSAASLAVGESTIGTAPSYQAYVMIETPVPWQPEVSDSMHFPAVWRDALNRISTQVPGVRLQGILPQDDFSPDRARVLFFHQDAGATAQFHKTEFLIDPEKLPALLLAWFISPEERADFDRYRVTALAHRDFFVCTHGVRDACCGRLGYPIFEVLRQRFEDDANVRVWRTTHLGGHRFAPTLLDMPEGRYWGRVEPAALDAIISRQGPVESVRPYLRGWAALAEPVLQIAEAEVLMRHGWSWLDMRRQAHTTEDAGLFRVRVTGIDARESRHVWEATVAKTDAVYTLASCGSGPPEEIPQFEVTRLVRVDEP